MGLLSPGQPPSEPVSAHEPRTAREDAKALLRRYNITVIEVVSVDHDSILFRGFNRMARTAWIGMRNGHVVTVQAEDGFNAQPNGWTLARLARECDPEPASGPSENTN